MKNEKDVADWLNAQEEGDEYAPGFADNLAECWHVVFGRSLADEDQETRGNAWSHLCSAVLWK